MPCLVNAGLTPFVRSFVLYLNTYLWDAQLDSHHSDTTCKVSAKIEPLSLFGMHALLLKLEKRGAHSLVCGTALASFQGLYPRLGSFNQNITLFICGLAGKCCRKSFSHNCGERGLPFGPITVRVEDSRIILRRKVGVFIEVKIDRTCKVA